MNLWAIFTTGLFVGGLTCMAVQGGLLAATIAQREEERLKEKAKDKGLLFLLTGILIVVGYFGWKMLSSDPVFF